MNVIDIIILLIFAYALYEGVRNGLVVQGVSAISVIVGIWLGMTCGPSVASMLGISGGASAMWGFIIVLILTLILLAVAARVLRKFLSFVGFGLVDKILGAALSMCKFLIILSVVFTAFDFINHSYKLVEHQYLEGSALFRPIANVSKLVTPVWDWAQTQINIPKL